MERHHVELVVGLHLVTCDRLVVPHARDVGMKPHRGAREDRVPVSRASCAMRFASSRLAASGLSMNILAGPARRRLRQCGRPSTLSSNTTSTLASKASMLSTSSTPCSSWMVLASPLDPIGAHGEIRAAALVGGDDRDLPLRVLAERPGERRHMRRVGADDPGPKRLRGPGRRRGGLRSQERGEQSETRCSIG